MASSRSGSMRPYQPGKRAMLKIKHQRTADCVVAGFRWHKNGPGTHIGSLLLGLYGDDGKLNHVGITSSFSWDRRRGAGGGARAAARRRDRRPPVARVGRMGRLGRCRSVRPAAARCDIALEPRQGPVVGAAPRSSGSPKSPTTTCRDRGSGTRPRSSAGDRTSRPSRAGTTSSRRASLTSSPASSGPTAEVTHPSRPGRWRLDQPAPSRGPRTTRPDGARRCRVGIT